MLLAITTSGIIYSHIKTGSYNGEQFLDWLEGLLQVMNPYPAPHSVLILDNCRMHHVEGVAEMCKERGINWFIFRHIHLTSTLLKSVSPLSSTTSAAMEKHSVLRLNLVM